MEPVETLAVDEVRPSSAAVTWLSQQAQAKAGVARRLAVALFVCAHPDA